MLGLSSLWLGCSVQKNYRTLAFFFDGVPNPNATDIAGNPIAARGDKTPRMLFAHAPYKEGNCQACHTDKTGNFLQPTAIGANACIDCHEKVLNEHAIMHGPVVARACLWCHHPHQSVVKELLRAPAPDICTQCHEPALLNPKVPEHVEGKVSCLQCHFAHGGPQHRFLKAERPQSPTTAPTTAPAPTALGSPVNAFPDFSPGVHGSKGRS